MAPTVSAAFLKILKLLKLLILNFLKIRRRPVSFCEAASRRPSLLIRTSGYVAHGSQEASAGEDLRSKAAPAPSWLRDFVRDIPAVHFAVLD